MNREFLNRVLIFPNGWIFFIRPDSESFVLLELLYLNSQRWIYQVPTQSIIAYDLVRTITNLMNTNYMNRFRLLPNEELLFILSKPSVILLPLLQSKRLTRVLRGSLEYFDYVRFCDDGTIRFFKN